MKYIAIASRKTRPVNLVFADGVRQHRFELAWDASSFLLKVTCSSINMDCRINLICTVTNLAGKSLIWSTELAAGMHINMTIFVNHIDEDGVTLDTESSEKEFVYTSRKAFFEALDSFIEDTFKDVEYE